MFWVEHGTWFVPPLCQIFVCSGLALLWLFLLVDSLFYFALIVLFYSRQLAWMLGRLTLALH